MYAFVLWDKTLTVIISMVVAAWLWCVYQVLVMAWVIDTVSGNAFAYVVLFGAVLYTSLKRRTQRA